MAACHESVKQPERIAPEHDLICVLRTAGTRAGRQGLLTEQTPEDG